MCAEWMFVVVAIFFFLDLFGPIHAEYIGYLFKCAFLSNCGLVEYWTWYNMNLSINKKSPTKSPFIKAEKKDL